MDPQSSSASPDVGVVIRTRDRPHFLFRSLQSVRSQSYSAWRAIIVNDGGDPAQVEQVVGEEFAVLMKSGRLAVVNNRPALGRARAFNVGMRELSSELCCCLDDDDTWDPAFLSEMVAGYLRLKQSFADLGAVCGQVTDVHEELADTAAELSLAGSGRFTKELRRSRDARYNTQDVFLSPVLYMLSAQDCLPVQLMFCRERLLEFGGFSELHDVHEERAMLVHFICKYRIGTVQTAISYHHVRTGPLSAAAYRNAMGDEEGYDWHLNRRSIEMSLFYDGARTAVPAKAMLFIVQEMLRHMETREGEFASRLANAMRKRELDFYRRNKLKLVAGLAMVLLGQLALVVLGVILAMRFLG